MGKRKLRDQTLVVASYGGLKLVIAIYLGQLGAHDGLGPAIFIGIFLQHHFEANQCGKRGPHKLTDLPELSLGAVSN